ncbi:MAG TPA: hypothetical protein VFV96_10960 [Verrucomicrobiae bacterium]|nr:hypothetical protein [Verrucomicrobiae bacterium]
MRTFPARLAAWLTFLALVIASPRGHADTPATSAATDTDAAHTRTIT